MLVGGEEAAELMAVLPSKVDESTSRTVYFYTEEHLTHKVGWTTLTT